MYKVSSRVSGRAKNCAVIFNERDGEGEGERSSIDCVMDVPELRAG